MLARCLASIQRHAPPHTEVIVVDDGSPAGCVTTTAARFDGVRVVQIPKSKGFCTAVNAGVAVAQGEIVELLNDDTEVLPGWAEPALAWFDDPTIGAVAPLVLKGPSGAMIDSAGDRYFIGGIAAKRKRGEPVCDAPKKAHAVFGACGSSAFYRREALRKVRGFPEEFMAYSDDIDVAFRLHRGRWRTMHEPASRVLHHVSASYGQPVGRLLEQQSLNEERVFWRNLPAGELFRALPLHFAVLAAKGVRRWREGNLRPFVRGRLRVLGEIRQLLQHRRRLREIGDCAPVSCWEVERRYWFVADR